MEQELNGGKGGQVQQPPRCHIDGHCWHKVAAEHGAYYKTGSGYWFEAISREYEQVCCWCGKKKAFRIGRFW